MRSNSGFVQIFTCERLCSAGQRLNSAFINGGPAWQRLSALVSPEILLMRKGLFRVILTCDPGRGCRSRLYPGHLGGRIVKPDSRAQRATVRMTEQKQSQLHALTTLRFVAALLVVLGHARGTFECLEGLSDRLVFDQAVSFFFILSGFILTYVYPQLPTWKSTLLYLVRRVARLWPLHLTVLIAMVTIIPKDLVTAPGAFPRWEVYLANLTMLHGWIPIRQFYFSYNSPSWSISTELFYYLLFPLLLLSLRVSMWLPALAAAGVAAGLIYLSNTLGLEFNVSEITEKGLLYVNPLARLLEFSVGIALACLYRRCAAVYRPGRMVGTLLEGFAFLFAGVCMYFTPDIGAYAQQLPLIGGSAGRLWALNCAAPMLGFAALILVMAMQKGVISRLLCLPLCVLLGEISYGVYMVHFPLLMYHGYFLQQYRSTGAFLLFLAILLVASHLLFVLVEKPTRALITQIAKKIIYRQEPSLVWVARIIRGFRESIYSNLALLTDIGRSHVMRVLVGAGKPALEILCLAGLIVLAHPPLARVPEAQARQMQSSEHRIGQTQAGDFLRLRSLSLQPDGGHVNMTLLWEALKAEKLDYFIQVEFFAADKSKVDERLINVASEEIKPGDLWLSSAKFAADKVKLSESMSLRVYKKSLGYLPIGGLGSDTAKTRLVVVTGNMI